MLVSLVAALVALPSQIPGHAADIVGDPSHPVWWKSTGSNPPNLKEPSNFAAWELSFHFQPMDYDPTGDNFLLAKVEISSSTLLGLGTISWGEWLPSSELCHLNSQFSR